MYVFGMIYLITLFSDTCKLLPHLNIKLYVNLIIYLWRLRLDFLVVPQKKEKIVVDESYDVI